MPKIEVPAFSINVKQAIIDEYVVDYLGEMFNGFEDDTWGFTKRIDAVVENTSTRRSRRSSPRSEFAAQWLRRLTTLFGPRCAAACRHKKAPLAHTPAGPSFYSVAARTPYPASASARRHHTFLSPRFNASFNASSMESSRRSLAAMTSS